MAGGPNAAAVFCLKCLGKAIRTYEGMENDSFRCQDCGQEFTLDYRRGMPLRPCWSEDEAEYKEAKRIAELFSSSRKPKTARWMVRLITYVAVSFIAAVIVAVLTPSVDAISMAIPWLITSAVFCCLFEIGWFVYRRKKK